MSNAASDRIHVLHVIDALGVGGTELAMANVIERTQNRLAHSVCCVRAGGATADRLTAQSIPVTVMHKKVGNDWGLPFRFARLFREAAPDIVHTRNWGSIDAIVGARLAGVPVVIHSEHGRDIHDPDGTNRRRNRARRALSLLVTRMVAVSDQLREWLIGEVGIPAAKVAVLKNGVDISRFQPGCDRAALRRELGYAPDDFIVGTVGRLDPVKNQASLVHALADLIPTHPRLRLVIVGDGPERPALEREIDRRQLGSKAVLLGHRHDIPAALGLLDVFILPSVGEGMCNTILEAMAIGLPVIATRVGGNPELVEHDVSGTLIPARDTQALAAAIARYAGDEGLRRDHGVAGRERVLATFTLDGMTERYVQLYRSELERKRCAA